MWTIDEQTKAVGGITPYSGVDTTNPVDVFAGNSSFGIVATTSAITTSAANEEVIALFATDVNKSFSTPTGVTQKYNLAHSGGPSTAAYDVLQMAAGSAGAKFSTISGNKPRNWVAQQIALRHQSAQISFDNISTFLGTSGSITVGAIANPAVVVHVTAEDFASVSAVTVGGQNAVLMGHAKPQDNSHSQGNVYLFIATNVDSGPNQITISIANNINAPYVDAVSYGGVNQTSSFDQVGTTTSINSTSIATTLTSTQDGAWAINTAENNGAYPRISAINMVGRTQGIDCSTTLNSCHYADSNGPIPLGTPFTQTWISSGAQTWNMVMAILRPAN